mgnify:CR=1 FL=1
MLELKDLHKTFNPGTVNAKTALNGLSLTLQDGEFVTVIGGNGAGKSTMLNATAGTLQVDSGEVFLDGIDVTDLPEYKRASYIGRVFQDPMMAQRPPCTSRKIWRWRHAAGKSAAFAGASPRRSERPTARC